MKGVKYWVVGANWDGIKKQDTFYLRGYWEMGYSDKDKPDYAQKRNSIQPNDRIAIKSMNGKGANTIKIHAIGRVKDVFEGKVFIDWVLTDMDRNVASHGLFSTIHGPFSFSKELVQEIFCL